MTNDPALIAYTVKRKADDGAFPHDQVASLNVVLNAMPLDNRIVLLELGEN